MNTYLTRSQIVKLHTVEEGSSWRGGGPLFFVLIFWGSKKLIDKAVRPSTFTTKHAKIIE